MTSPLKNEWAQVVFPHPPAGHFTYSVPSRFRHTLAPGCRVVVPLGRRRVTGFVVAFCEKPDFKTIKAIEDVLDDTPLLEEDLMALSAWMAEYYLCGWGEVIRTALPPGMMKKERLLVAPGDENDAGDAETRALLTLLAEKGPLYADQLRRRLKMPLPRHRLNRWAAEGLITLTPVMEEAQARIQTEAHYALAKAVDAETLQAMRKKAPRQAYVLETLMGATHALPRPDIDVAATVLNRLEETGWIVRDEREKIRNPYDPDRVKPMQPVTLTDEQTTALTQINRAGESQQFATFLLHGVTGSGKTQVYIEALRETLKRGQGALVLIPEIALTPQAVERYQGAFGDQVAVLHSRMSIGERYDAWRELRRGRYRIALGPRSAVFAPVNNLGLVVVDEEHDGSYKQVDPAPRYHARDVAIVRAKLASARVILGSATPSLESYFNTDQGKYSLIEMKQRIDNVAMPLVRILDRSKLEPWDENRVFDARLIKAMTERIAHGEQVILLQNRRGFATYLRCGSCGTVENCPHCDISLTFHQNDGWMRCHYCGYQKRAANTCTECGEPTLKFRGVGTQRVEEDLAAALPGVKTIRMDQDTTQHKGAHERLLSAFERREADVLIGTQMVAKGHDFPGVHLVGIISADTGLHFPDFRAGERTFQLLTQTAGRAGRRDRQGQVFVQTQYAGHPVLDFAKEHDYNAFYAYEIAQRKELGYPPWGRVAMMRFRGVEEQKVALAADRFRQQLPRCPGVDILGPVPSPLAKLQNQYRYQIIFRSRRSDDPSGRRIRQLLRDGIRRYNSNGRIEGVATAVDVDPNDLL